MSEDLHIVTVVFNPGKYETRYKLFNDFIQQLSVYSGIKVYTVELTIGDQDYAVTDPSNPQHLQLHTEYPLWYKENLVNLAVKKLLPADWKYVAWIDADIIFQNVNWVEDSVQALQKYDVIQLFETAVDLGKREQAIYMWKSFGSYNSEDAVIEPYESCDSGCGDTKKVTPGFAWACTRPAWEAMGGLHDACIVGSGDYHMAMALVNRVEETFHSEDLHGYNCLLLEWQKKVQGLKLGFAPGTIYHRWHGDRKNRKYQERRRIIEHNCFDPRDGLSHDSNGLITLVGSAKDMISDFVHYFFGRKEDS